MALTLDTSVLYASLDRRDGDHFPCRNLIELSEEPLIIPAPVPSEVDYLVNTRMHPGVFVALLDDIVVGAYDVENVRADEYGRIRDLCDRYTDANIGFVDAAVLTLVERMNEPKLATLDYRHFRSLRPRHVDALRLLPEDG